MEEEEEEEEEEVEEEEEDGRSHVSLPNKPSNKPINQSINQSIGNQEESMNIHEQNVVSTHFHNNHNQHDLQFVVLLDHFQSTCNNSVI